MIDDYKLVKMKSSPIVDPEMVAKYASLGYFHYQYIKTLEPLNSCENLMKDNGVIRGRAESQFKEGSYMEISVVDFTQKKKVSCLFMYPQHRLRVSVGDIIDLCEFIHSSLRVDDSNCFVKFDVYTIVK